MSASAKPELELPSAPPITGEPLPPDEAREALDTNDAESASVDDESPLGGEPVELAPPRDVEPAAAERPRGRPTKNGVPTVGTLLRRFPTKKRLAEEVAAASQRAAELQAQLDTLTATANATNVLGADVVDASIRDMVGDVVNLADSAAQLSVSEKYAPAVALVDEERDRLITLAARVAKVRAGSQLAKAAPEIALAVAAVSIVLGKVIAYKLAQKERAAAGVT